MRSRLLPALFLVVLFLFAALFIFPAQVARAADCSSAQSGNWSDPATWSCSVVPGAEDNVTINDGHTVTLTADADVLNLTVSGTLDLGSHALTVHDGGSLTNDGAVNGTGVFRTAGTVSLNIYGAFNPPLSIASGTTTAYSGSLNAAVTVASGATLQVPDGSSLRVNANLTAAGTLAIGAGASLSVSGDLSVSGALTGDAGSSLFFSGSAFSLTGSALPVANVHFRGSGAQTLTGSGFANWTGAESFEVASGASVALPANATMAFWQYTIDGAFSLNGHTLTLNPADYLTFTNSGTLDIGNQTFTFAAPGAATFSNYGYSDDFQRVAGTVNGTGSFRTTGWVSLNLSGGDFNCSTFNPPLSVASGGTTTEGCGGLNGAVTVASGATLQVPNWNGLMVNANLTAAGTLAIGANAWLSVDGDLSVSGALTGDADSSLFFSGSTFSLTGSGLSVANVHFDGSAVQTLTGSGFANWTGTGSFEVGSSASVALPANATMSFSQYIIDGAFSLNGHTLTLNPAADLTFYNSGALDIGAQTFTFATPGGATFTNHGTVNGTGAFRTSGAVSLNVSDGVFNPPLTVASGATAASGVLTGTVAVASGATLQVPDWSNNLTVNANLTAAGTLAVGIDSALSVGDNLTATGTLAIGANASLSVGGNLSVSGASTWGAGSSLYFSGSAFSLTGSALSVDNVHFEGSGAQTLTGSGFANWTGAGSFEVGSGASVALPTDATMAFSRYTINGAFSLNGRTLTLNPAANLTFYSFGTFDIGAQTFAFAAPGGATFDNYGTVNGTGVFRTSGTVSLWVNGGAFNPPLSVASGATTASGALNGAVSVASGATLQVSYLTVNGNLTVAGTLVMSAGYPLSVGGDLSVTGALTGGDNSILYFSGSSFSLAGSAMSVASIYFDGSGVQTLTGSAFANWTGTGIFEVGSSASVALPTDATMAFRQYTINGTFSLNGHTLTLNPAANLIFTNSGTLDIGAQTFAFTSAGTATFNNSGTVNGTGTFRTSSGTVILYAGSNFNPPLSVASGTTLALGTLNGAVTVASGAALAVPDRNNLAVKGNLIAGTLVIGANATLSLAGNLTATNSGTSGATTGTVVFNGAGLQNLTANTPTSFANLTVNSGVTLVETVAADNVSVSGTLTNHGTIRKTQAISGAGPKTFGLTGVQVDVATAGSLTSLQVDRVDSNHPNATASVRTGRYWTVTPTGAGYSVNLILPHNGLNDPTACRYTGSHWDCARTTFTPTTVTRNGVTALSPWAVGNNARSRVFLPIALRK